MPTATTATIKVVDASAIAAVLFDDLEAPSVRVRLEDSRLVAPALLPFEIANVCVKKIRRDPQRRADFLSAFRLLELFAVELSDVDPRAIALLAAETGLSAYDASYLWLTRRLDAELVTLDKKLARAAAQIR